MSFKIEEILDEISNDFIEELLNIYGGTVKRTRKGDLMCSTVCHGGDSHKLYWYPESQRFMCYTNCGSMSIFDFVMHMEHCTFPESVQFLGEMLGLEDSRSFSSVPNFSEIREFSVPAAPKLFDWSSVEIPKLDEYDEGILSELTAGRDVPCWKAEGISQESMSRFGISWAFEATEYGYCNYYPAEDGEEPTCAIIIPHRDLSGRLVGVRRRTFCKTQLDAGRKYMPVFYGRKSYAHSTGSNLYGIFENKETIRETKTAFIFEGEKSVLLIDSFYNGKSNAVATCGFNVTQIQTRMLMDLGVETVYLCFDKDYDLTLSDDEAKQTYGDDYQGYNHYRSSLKRICDQLSSAGLSVYLVYDNGPKKLLGAKDAPVDKGKEVFEVLKSNAVLYSPERHEEIFGL